MSDEKEVSTNVVKNRVLEAIKLHKIVLEAHNKVQAKHMTLLALVESDGMPSFEAVELLKAHDYYQYFAQEFENFPALLTETLLEDTTHVINRYLVNKDER